MQKLEKAKLIAHLLDAKRRHKMARSQAKRYIGYEIVSWRRRLGMKIATSDSILERIRGNPVDPTKTLTSTEYCEKIKTWLPGAYVDLSNCSNENSKGISIALNKFILRYPMICSESRAIETISSVKGFDGFLNYNGRIAESNVDEILNNERIEDEFPKDLESKHLEYASTILSIPGFSEVLSYEGALTVVGFYKVRSQAIKDALKLPKINTRDFLDLCSQEAKRAWAKEEANKKLKSRNPELVHWSTASVKHWLKLWDYNAFYRNQNDGRGIIFGRLFETDRSEAKKASIESGFSAKVRITSPHHGAEMTMMHELGHALDLRLGFSKSPEFLRFKEKIKGQDIGYLVSRYAKINDRELVAEAFAEYMLSDTPRSAATEIGRMLDEAYAKWTGEAK